MWTPLEFGKYKGKTLPQIVLRDPDWFFWAHEVGALSSVQSEADDAHRKARSIKPPRRDGEEQLVEYIIHEATGKSLGFRLVTRRELDANGYDPMCIGEVIDLSVPRQLCPYDKLGGRLLVADMKVYVFRNKAVRLTKKECEGFFECESNFVLGN
jgi:hypothetical protein